MAGNFGILVCYSATVFDETHVMYLDDTERSNNQQLARVEWPPIRPQVFGVVSVTIAFFLAMSTRSLDAQDAVNFG